MSEHKKQYDYKDFIFSELEGLRGQLVGAIASIDKAYERICRYLEKQPKKK